MSEQEPGLEEDPRIGRMIGNYRVTRLIGRGGFGSVYLASHPDIDLQVAIKVLDMNRPDIVQRFMAEAHAASKLKHPNIIKIFDLGKTEDGHAYYNMEALEGMELEELMTRWLQARGRMSMAKLAPYLEQICSALELAHDQGIVHRDLKPENIFLEGGAGGTVKVLDFGIAKQRDSAGARTKTGIILGTPQRGKPAKRALEARS